MRDKQLFLGLCAAVWFINTSTAGAPMPADIWMGLAASIISIPAWALIGSASASIGIFLLRFAKVNVMALSMWQKADVGLAMAVVLKPALGIPF